MPIAVIGSTASRPRRIISVATVFQDAAHAAHQFSPKRRQAEHDPDQPEAKRYKADHFAGDGDLAFLARLLKAPWRRLFCFVLATFLAAARHGSTNPRQGKESLTRDIGVNPEHGRQ
jgi:hypothetical protein